MGTDTEEQAKFNPNRRLCPDGSCTGVVGPAGLCLECGVKDPGWTPGAADASPLPASDVVEPPAPVVEKEDEPVKEGQRRLCPDGTCIGILGPNGICGTCGKRGESPSLATEN